MKFANDDHRKNTLMLLAGGVKVLDGQGREITLADVLDKPIHQGRVNKPAVESGPRDFAKALRLQLNKGHAISIAIKLAAKEHPHLYQRYCAELTNPEPTGPPERVDHPIKANRTADASINTRSKAFASEIRKQLKAGKDDEAATEAAIKANPEAHREYLRTLQQPDVE